MKSIFNTIALAIILTPQLIMAQTMGLGSPSDNCLVDFNGDCVIVPNPNPNPNPPFLTGNWIGGWYDFSGDYHTVSANSFRACTALLEEATQGMMVITSTCTRA